MRKPRQLRHPADYEKSKVCKDCGERKVWAEFPVNVAEPDGRSRCVRGRCYKCHAAVGNKQRARRKAGYVSPRGSHRNGPLVPAARLAEWLGDHVERVYSYSDLSAWVGVDEGTLRKVAAGSLRSIGFDIVDRLALATGNDLDDLLESRTCAWCGQVEGWPWGMRLEVPILVPVLAPRVPRVVLDYCYDCMNPVEALEMAA